MTKREEIEALKAEVAHLKERVNFLEIQRMTAPIWPTGTGPWVPPVWYYPITTTTVGTAQ